MKRTVNVGGVSQSKLEQIRQGVKKTTDIGGVKENKKVIQGKGGKFTVTEKEKKFEETGVTRKKRNYVMYESKLGTQREKNLQKIEEAQKPKPKPKPAPAKPRVEEKIIQKKIVVMMRFRGEKEVMEINRVLIMGKNRIKKEDIINIKEIDIILEMIGKNIKIINIKIIIIKIIKKLKLIFLI